MLVVLKALVWLVLLPFRLIGWMLLLPLLLFKAVLGGLVGVAIVPFVAAAGLVALAVAVVLPLLPLLLLAAVVWGVFAVLSRPAAAA